MGRIQFLVRPRSSFYARHSQHLKHVADSSGFITRHLAQTGKRRACVKQLEDDICQLAAHIDAAMFRWLELLREFDACEGWAGDGIKSSATAPALLYLLHPCSRVPTG